MQPLVNTLQPRELPIGRRPAQPCYVADEVAFAGIEGTGTWTVVEFEPPYALALETTLGIGQLRIGYQLEPAGDGRTRFQRDLDFPELGPEIRAAMEAQSAAGVASLARLVERETGS